MIDKRSRVVPDARTSQLVVVATEHEQSDVDRLLNQLDKPTRQVVIETKLIELSSNPSTSKGVDWSGTLQAQNVSFGNGVLHPASSSTTTIPGTPVTTPVVSPSGPTVHHHARLQHHHHVEQSQSQIRSSPAACRSTPPAD